ncbi:MAG: hypothetical protein HBSAPP03_15390 [Phycisphaerae bacterium]|jgi:hypothetical protein|nr:MAG: hypothetical protein HBSAPP03_15390 [Phycisphaerae bacterium]
MSECKPDGADARCTRSVVVWDASKEAGLGRLRPAGDKADTPPATTATQPAITPN